MSRYSGILMHISSLPSRYGIGTLGKEAYKFADFLHAAGQHYWQILPIGPTGYGDSPYQSVSSDAGNPYLIDLDLLIEDGLLTEEEVTAIDWSCSEKRVDYGFLYNNRFKLLRKAHERGAADEPALQQFRAENPWVENYALYMAIKSDNEMKRWDSWPDALRRHEEAAVADAAERLKDEVHFYAYIQFLFYRQWDAFRNYVHSLGMELIGDLPIYVPMDSCDIWAHASQFQLDQDSKPTGVAGVPPDYFSADGQLWGNPLYDWESMKKDGFTWWKQRIGHAGTLFDVIRIDHFRALESYWFVPYGDETAKNGHWITGPGLDFIRCLQEEFPGLQLIAEDLGDLTPAVHELRDASVLPGMRVLGFAFDGACDSEYLPHHYVRNCIAYSGTHDNPTLVQWISTAEKKAVEFACEYLDTVPEKLPAAIIRAGMSSVSDTFIAPIQDWLELGKEARMNFPGTASSDNWTWRLAPGAVDEALTKRIRRMTELYARCEKLPEPLEN